MDGGLVMQWTGPTRGIKSLNYQLTSMLLILRNMVQWVKLSLIMNLLLCSTQSIDALLYLFHPIRQYFLII